MNRHAVADNGAVVNNGVGKEDAIVANSGAVADIAARIERAVIAETYTSADRRSCGDVRVLSDRGAGIDTGLLAEAPLRVLSVTMNRDDRPGNGSVRVTASDCRKPRRSLDAVANNDSRRSRRLQLGEVLWVRQERNFVRRRVLQSVGGMNLDVWPF
jgi:hypothetical protein